MPNLFTIILALLLGLTGGIANPKLGDIGVGSLPPVKLAGTYIVPRNTNHTIGTSTANSIFNTSTSTTICIGSDCRTSWPTGVTDHGALTGLSDDDHTQYHTDGRALTWLGTRSTSDLPEGSRLYYTDGRARAVWSQDLYSSSSPSFSDLTATATGTIGGNLRVDTDTFYVDAANNRVGIGTSTPQFALDIVSAVSTMRFLALPGANAVLRLGISDNATQSASVNFLNASSSAVGQIGYTFSTNRMNFNTNAATRLVIDSSGNVGIATTTPNSTVQVGTPRDATSHYMQMDAASGTIPAATDCDSDTETGRYFLSASSTVGGSRLYVCTGSTNGWDYSPLTN